MKTKAEAEGELVKVLMLVSVEHRDKPGGPPRMLAQGYVVEVDRVAGTLFVLMGWATPQEGWSPSPQDEQAVSERFFEALENERRARGVSEAEAERTPGLARRYRKLEAILTAAGAPPLEVA
jgi:hypothetical protein